MGLKPRLKRRAGHRRAVRRWQGRTRAAEPPADLAREWQARNGGKRWYWRGPLAIEWGLEWFVDRLRSLALFDLLELAGRATILVAVAFWFLEAGDRAKERHYRAWDLINSARGSTGDGGRRDALQDLAKDGVSLAGAPLEQAWIPFADLRGADLTFANLQDANLWHANLQGGALQGANPQGAHNLTQEQLDSADGNDQTGLPAHLTRPAPWSKVERNEGQSAPQPDDGGQAPAADGAPRSGK